LPRFVLGLPPFAAGIIQGGVSMSTQPKSVPGPSYAERQRIESVAWGQKLVIYALLAYIAAVALKVCIGVGFVALIGAAALIMSIIGVVKLLSALEYPIVVNIVLIALLVVPLANLLVILSLIRGATKTLREAGYKVGLLGAYKTQDPKGGLAQ